MNTALPEKCPNCAHALAGKFCHECGEEMIESHDLSVKYFFAHHLAHELTHLDGKIFQTFKLLLFRPGYLTAEYFAGRRRRYIKPLRLFLTVCVLFAFVALMQSPQARPLRETIAATDPTGFTLRLLADKVTPAEMESKIFQEKFFNQSNAYGTALSLASVFFFALVLLALYFQARKYYVEHLVCALHLVSGVALLFLFFILIEAGWKKLAGASVGLPSAWQSFSRSFVFMIIPLSLEAFYLFIAFRKFYHSSIARALFAVPLVMGAMFLLQSLFTAVGYWIALLTL